jgi:uncharacterized protein DUF6496
LGRPPPFALGIRRARIESMLIAKSELHMAFERERCSAPETEEAAMTETKPVERAKEEVEQGKRPSTAAGEFVREEMHHIREGKHGARSTKQAIAIGLSKARRAGVPLKPPSTRRTSERTHEAAERDYQIGQGQRKPRAPSRKRARAVSKALKREGRGAASKAALSQQAQRSASRVKRLGRRLEPESGKGLVADGIPRSKPKISKPQLTGEPPW